MPDTELHELAPRRNKKFAADFFGVSVSTIERWMRDQNGLRFVRVGLGKNRLVRFRDADLVAFAERLKQNGKVERS